MQRLFRRLSTVESISRRLRLSFRMLVILLVVPAVISIAAMLSNNMRYNDIIAHMGQVGDLKPKVAVDIPDEAWRAVAGYEAFDDVRLFQMLHEVNVELDELLGSMAGPNQVELTAARRAMDTLREKDVYKRQGIGKVRNTPPTSQPGGAPPGALLNYGKIPRSFFAPTTRLSADMYAPMRREAFFSAASAQTSSKAWRMVRSSMSLT